MERLEGRQVLVFGLLIGLLAWAAVLLLPPGAGRSAFVTLLLVLGGVAGLVLVVLTRLERQRLEQPLRELTAAVYRFEETAPMAFTATGPVVDELAVAYARLHHRLTLRMQQLEDDRKQLGTILSGMIEGVVALDCEQRILFANERAAKLLEVEMARLVGRRFWEVVRQRPLLDIVQRALHSADTQQEEVLWNGDVARSLLVHAVSLPGPPPRGAVVVLHDTSDLRRLERLRQEFVANVSHELKTPLSVIRVCVEALLEPGGLDDTESRLRFLTRIGHQAVRLQALILDLLSLARLDAGQESFEFAAIPLAPLVEAYLDSHRLRAAAKNQTLALVADAPVRDLEVWADEEGLAVILNNLLDNAVKYTPDGGRIEVSWRRDGDAVVLSVADTGIGIPEGDLPRVFERFYRVDKARSRELGGTGLGLSIVKHLAQAMGGSAAAASEVGRGSTFSITLLHPDSPTAASMARGRSELGAAVP